ncbi:hypothetical protein Ctob_012631, partial [Chrysochromulina tobinii]
TKPPPLPRATLATTSRSAGTAAATAAATISPRRCTLHPTPTPTRHRAPPTDQMSPTARTARPDPTFSRLLRRLQLRSSRSRTSLWCGVQCAGCTSACDLTEAGTAEYVPCGQV